MENKKRIIKSSNNKQPIKKVIENKINVTKDKIRKEKAKKGFKNRVLTFIMIILVSIVSFVTLFALYIIIFSPPFNEDNLFSMASSVLYDKDGNEYAKLGAEKRELVTYEELPEVLIDAIIATEDSRFFQHNGLDVARFAKAVAGQLLGQSSAGGGSTITMQVSKNSFTDNTATGIKGLVRKFTDIYLSIFKIEKNYTKEQILEFYVNAPFLGSNSYGVEEISQTYFNKSVRDLSLVEAAVVAGLFQAPGAYNPYVNPNATNKRKNTVLNLMYRHGYITEEEKNIAQSIDVTTLLAEKNTKTSMYQGFIDTVIDEVIERTGKSPYKISMKIYTTMDPKVQEVLYGVQSGDTTSFRDDVIDLGMAITSVKDGSIVGIGAGRKSVTDERTLNLATGISRHPGSTAKPYMVYGPGIEFNRWSTATTFFDEEWKYSSGGSLKNADGKYNGIMTLKKALASSRNIPAIQGFQQLDNSSVVKFASSLGISLELGASGEVYESAAIGGFEGVSPLMQSAAYASFARNGYYIEPYSYTKIIYQDTDEVETYKPVKTKVMSEETAYMINMVLKYAVDSGYIVGTSAPGDIAGKTGTSTFDSAFRKKIGLPNSSIMDSWVIMYSPEYAYAQWYGYKEMTAEQVQNKQYLTSSSAASTRKIYAKQVVNNVFKNGASWSKPNGVIKADIELETVPVQLASDYTPKELRSTEYFLRGTEPTDTSIRFSQLDNVTNLQYENDSINGGVKLTWDNQATPSAINSSWLSSYFTNNYSNYYSKFGVFADKYYQQRLTYNNTNIGSMLYHIYLKNNDGSLISLGTTTNNYWTYNSINTSGLTFVVKTEYSIFKANTSSGSQVTISSSSVSVTLRGSENITLVGSGSSGTYQENGSPVNVTDNGINVTDQATITTKYYKNIDEVSSIPLNSVGSYKIKYTIVYKEKTYTLTRNITIN